LEHSRKFTSQDPEKKMGVSCTAVLKLNPDKVVDDSTEKACAFHETKHTLQFLPHPPGSVHRVLVHQHSPRGNGILGNVPQEVHQRWVLVVD
jgi:hypothetical protein